METITLTSTITCPACGAATTTEMPEDACQFFWTCPACETTLHPQEGACCVFCSYGDVRCPPVQRAGDDFDASACRSSLDAAVEPGRRKNARP